jgi:hypothetical protein
MRPAPPDDSFPNHEPFPEHGRAARSAGQRNNPRLSSAWRWLTHRIGPSFLAMGMITGAAIAFVSCGGGGPPKPSQPPSTSPSLPPREAFVFPLSHTTSVATRKRNAIAARRAAADIQATLSSFYDAAFMDPNAWKRGLSAGAWNAFASSIRERAMKDAASLTIGEAGTRLTSLSITNASLSIRVLLDPNGRPEAAVATVVFETSGSLTGGEPVMVSNQASFLMQPIDGGWLVVGYPKANTEVEAPSPTPSPSAASPSSGASP